MSTKRRERRPQRPPGVAATPRGQPSLPALPAWHWRTFPVFFAFALGTFLGVYFGWFAGIIQESGGNGVFTYVVFITSALLLGFGLSRLTSRWMISRNWIKPRPRRK